MVTRKQKMAVKLIVETLRIPFKGDIENIKNVKEFLDEHFDDAKLLASQLEKIEEYYGSFRDFDMAYGADNM